MASATAPVRGRSPPRRRSGPGAPAAPARTSRRRSPPRGSAPRPRRPSTPRQAASTSSSAPSARRTGSGPAARPATADDPGRQRRVGGHVEAAVGRHVELAVVGGDQQRGVRRQPVRPAGRAARPTSGAAVPPGRRVDPGLVPALVQVGVVAVDQAGPGPAAPRASRGDSASASPRRRTSAPRLAATVRPLPSNSGRVTAVTATPGRGRRLEAGRHRLPLAGSGSSPQWMWLRTRPSGPRRVKPRSRARRAARRCRG